MSRRSAAVLALLGGAVAVALGLHVLVVDFPRGIALLACVLVALGTAWLGLLRRGLARGLALALALALLAVAGVLMANGHRGLVLAGIVAAFALALVGARLAFRPDRAPPPAPPPPHPVLLVNPRSGEGRAGREGLQEAAARRGIETVVLAPGDDLEQLVRAAVGRGADGVAMAGGDGSQALVAAIAAEHDLPYACIPAGTRNHFALDLGVDREDVVGALDAFVDGGERYVDLGEVTGRVFVNNVSLGVYAQAVSEDRYRGSKLLTLLDTLTSTLGPQGEPVELRWRDPDGHEQRSTALVLVSSNPYRLGATLGSGTRPRLDSGLLGIVDFHPPLAGRRSDSARWRELTAPELEIECDQPVPLGVDGEAVTLQPPLRFRVRPSALRVRVARSHPGASPSAELPEGLRSAVSALFGLAAGRS